MTSPRYSLVDCACKRLDGAGVPLIDVCRSINITTIRARENLPHVSFLNPNLAVDTYENNDTVPTRNSNDISEPK